VSAFLLISMGCGLVCTCYSVTSCQFFALDYGSTKDFDQYFFLRGESSNNYTSHTVGVGLFTWLRPFDTSQDWNDGTCAGYNQLQRNVIVDETFDALRIAGIVAVMLSFTIFLFALSMSCLSFSRIQRVMTVLSAVATSGLTGSSFMMTQSGICTEIGDHPNCVMDKGALAAIAGVGFWALTAAIAFYFLQSIPKGKLSPKMMEKRKKGIRKRQLDMLKQLEELEVARKSNVQSRLYGSSTRSDSLLRPSVVRAKSAKQFSSARSTASTQRSASFGSPPSSPARKSPSTRIPETLPQNRKKHKQPIEPHSRDLLDMMEKNRRKHKQPIEPHSHDFLDMMEKKMARQQSDIAVVVREAGRPAKKRRLKGDQLPKSPRVDLSGGSPMIADRLHRASSQVFIDKDNDSKEQTKRGSSPNRQQQKSQTDFDRVFESTNTKYMGTMLAPKTGSLRRDIPRTRCTVVGTNSADFNYSLPLFMNRDVSTVIKHKDMDKDVEVYITDTLDNIDSMLDEDEEYSKYTV